MSKHTALRILSGYRNHFVSNTTDIAATGTRDNDITNKFSMLCLYQAAIAAEMSQYKEDNK